MVLVDFNCFVNSFYHCELSAPLLAIALITANNLV